MTDLYSGWTENRAILSKSSLRTKEMIENIERDLPMAIIGFASDERNL